MTQGNFKNKELKQSPPEMRLSSFYYALTLLNLYCEVSLLLKRQFAPNIWAQPLPQNAKSPLPVDVRR